MCPRKKKLIFLTFQSKRENVLPSSKQGGEELDIFFANQLVKKAMISFKVRQLGNSLPISQSKLTVVLF